MVKDRNSSKLNSSISSGKLITRKKRKSPGRSQPTQFSVAAEASSGGDRSGTVNFLTPGQTSTAAKQRKLHNHSALLHLRDEDRFGSLQPIDINAKIDIKDDNAFMNKIQ